MIREKIPSRSGFSLPRAFHPWSRIYRSPSGSFKKGFFVGSYWTSNPAVVLESSCKAVDKSARGKKYTFNTNSFVVFCIFGCECLILGLNTVLQTSFYRYLVVARTYYPSKSSVYL